MAVTIPFIADMSEVRAEISRLMADLRANPARVAVAGSGSTAPLGGSGGGPPSIDAALGPSRVSGGPGRGLDPDERRAPRVDRARVAYDLARAPSNDARIGILNEAGQNRDLFDLPTRIGYQTQGARLQARETLREQRDILSRGRQAERAENAYTRSVERGRATQAARILKAESARAAEADEIAMVPDDDGGGGAGRGGRGGGRGSSAFSYLSIRRTFIAHQVARLGMAAYERGNAMTLAGHDARAQYDAEQQFQGAVTGIPVVGPIAGLGAEFLSGNAGLKGKIALQGADLNDRQTGMMRQTDDARARMRGRDAVDAQTEPFEKRIEVTRQAYAEERRQIQQTKREMSELNAARLNQMQVDGDSPGMIGQARSAMARGVERYGAEAELSAARHQAYEQREIRRDEAFTVNAAIQSAVGDIQGSNYDAINQPRAGQRAALVNAALVRRMQGEHAREDPYITDARSAADAAAISAFDAGTARSREARARGFQSESYALTATLNRDPLGAQLAQIEGQRLQAKLQPDLSSDERSQIDANSASRAALARRRYGEDRGLELQGLEGRGRSLRASLNGGYYGSEAGQATSILEAAKQAAEQRRLEDPKGSENARAQIFQNSILELQLIQKNRLMQFRPSEVDPLTTDLSQDRNSDATKFQETMVELLREAVNNLRKVGVAL